VGAVKNSWIHTRELNINGAKTAVIPSTSAMAKATLLHAAREKFYYIAF